MSWTDAGRKKAAAARRGIHLSAATRKKISRALTGKKHHHTGHVQSTATRSLISRTLKKKKGPSKGYRIGSSAKKQVSIMFKPKRVPHRLRIRESNSFKLAIHGRRHGTTNAQVLQVRYPRGGKDNNTILQAKLHRIISKKPSLTNRAVIHAHLRRHRKRGRMA